ncbi:hypothetical protein MUU72_02540 [Streptomyces sp. RS10V-4]|uniref:hypothetical protein n=1 Tax=Streptomyces rhizoryzae TaxID=2932493 RepID=UPI002003C02B|nr:hypothetical protein [Streptomyces rhizoryzae]MCK7622014.1 hypothetical protein [Streptomyces rhizoryzae]
METELVTLATAGATTLVQQMATEGWAVVRRRVAALLARRRDAGDEASVERELDAARDDVLSAREDGDEAVPQGVAAVWGARLRRLLAEDPAAADELRALLDEVAPRRDQGTVRDIHNTINNHSEMHGVVIQAGFVSGPVQSGGPHPG